MMTREDKMESFKKILSEEINEKYEAELTKISEETEKIITEYKAKKYEEIEKLRKEYRTKLDNKTDKIHSKTLKEGQDIILNTYKEIYADFFKYLREDLILEYKEEKGEQYLTKFLNIVKPEINIDDVIYLFEGTFQRDEKIVKNILGDIKIEKSTEMKIGGFEIENLHKTYRLNYSLDFLLNSKYQKILSELKKEIEMGN